MLDGPRCTHLIIEMRGGIPGLEWLGFIPKLHRECVIGLMDRDGVQDPRDLCDGCPIFEASDRQGGESSCNS
jgi:hypothetical protein